MVPKSLRGWPQNHDCEDSWWRPGSYAQLLLNSCRRHTWSLDTDHIIVLAGPAHPQKEEIHADLRPTSHGKQLSVCKTKDSNIVRCSRLQGPNRLDRRDGNLPRLLFKQLLDET
jgi:hypothetical protein